MDAFEIQAKCAGRWVVHGSISGDKDTALKTWRYVKETMTAEARLVQFDYKGRVHVVAKQKQRSGYRVTYGETMPVWSRVLPTEAEAKAFADKQRSFGDVVFDIAAE